MKKIIKQQNIEVMKQRMEHARNSRVPKSIDERTKSLSISLKIAEISALKALGGGKVTRGIRRLLALSNAQLNKIKAATPNNTTTATTTTAPNIQNSSTDPNSDLL